MKCFPGYHLLIFKYIGISIFINHFMNYFEFNFPTGMYTYPFIQMLDSRESLQLRLATFMSS